MSYKKYNLEVIAADYNSSFFRHIIFTVAFQRYQELIGVPNVVFGVISRKNQIEYLVDMRTWMKTYKALKKKALADEDYIDGLIDRSIQWGQEMNNWTDKNIFEVDLKKMNADELIKLLKEFIRHQADGYTYGTPIPLLDFQGFSFVENNLNKFLKTRVSQKDFKKVFNVFTQPLHNSFAQDQEEDLLRLMSQFYQDKQWQQDIMTKDLAELKNIYSKFYLALEKHTQKHTWVYYVYSGPGFTINDFLGFVKDYLNKKVNPLEKLQEFQGKKKEIENLKNKYIKEFKPDRFNLKILNLSGKIVWGKSNRKDYMSRAYYHAEKLLREIASRLYISLDQVRSTPINILEESLIDGKEIDLDLINSIYNFHICLPNGDQTNTILYDKEAEDFSRNNITRAVQENIKNVAEVTGDTAYAGLAKGVVKIINRPIDMAKMEYGDILVSTATTPSIVPAMKKAAAIVTDEGGLTCHASIVSREMSIPCVVGTKIATKVLKDGDMVEVDATKGIVRKI